MPVKRRLAKARAHRITPEIAALWVRLKALKAAGATDPYHEQRDEYLDALHAVDRALGVWPWEQEPLYAEREEPPEWMRDEWRREDWRRVWELRCALDAASARVE